MNDLPLTAPLQSNLPEYTVSELSMALKRSIEEGFSHVRVRGEISGFKRHGSGHCYFALKDSDAVIDAVCWRNTAIRLPIRPEDGMEVVCTGRLTTYPGRSKYQLVIDSITLAGIGALLKILEDRRQRLAAEGLFAVERKKKLPFLPQVIGIVTSPSGAVIRDILHRLSDRFPRHVLVWPVAVQGEGAAAQVAAAIEGFNRLAPGGRVPRPDLLIVARGGGGSAGWPAAGPIRRVCAAPRRSGSTIAPSGCAWPSPRGSPRPASASIWPRPGCVPPCSPLISAVHGAVSAKSSRGWLAR